MNEFVMIAHLDINSSEIVNNAVWKNNQFGTILIEFSRLLKEYCFVEMRWIHVGLYFEIPDCFIMPTN